MDDIRKIEPRPQILRTDPRRNRGRHPNQEDAADTPQSSGEEARNSSQEHHDPDTSVGKPTPGEPGAYLDLDA